jgi:hypothetical protein
MKYIVYQDGNKELLVAFPLAVNHDRMAEALEALRFGGDHNWHRRQGQIVSAGFIIGGECSGHSETLGISSRKFIDTNLFKLGGHRDVEPLNKKDGAA